MYHRPPVTISHQIIHDRFIWKLTAFGPIEEVEHKIILARKGELSLNTTNCLQ